MLTSHREGIIVENHIVSKYLICTTWFTIIAYNFIFIFLLKNITFISIKWKSWLCYMSRRLLMHMLLKRVKDLTLVWFKYRVNSICLCISIIKLTCDWFCRGKHVLSLYHSATFFWNVGYTTQYLCTWLFDK